MAIFFSSEVKRQEGTSETARTQPKAGAAVGDQVVVYGLFDNHPNSGQLSTWPTSGWNLLILEDVGSRTLVIKSKTMTEDDVAATWLFPSAVAGIVRGTTVTLVAKGVDPSYEPWLGDIGYRGAAMADVTEFRLPAAGDPAFLSSNASFELVTDPLEMSPATEVTRLSASSVVRVTPGAPGTPVDGDYVYSPAGNVGDVARWDSDGAIYSSSGQVDIWNGTDATGRGNSISAVVTGAVSGQVVAVLSDQLHVTVLQQEDGAWVANVINSSTSTVLATAPWDSAGQRVMLGSDLARWGVQIGRTTYQMVGPASSALLFRVSGQMRLRDLTGVPRGVPSRWPMGEQFDVYPWNNLAKVPGVGRWAAFGTRIMPLNEEALEAQQLRIRLDRSGTNLADSIKHLDGGEVGKWSPAVVTVQQTSADIDNIDVNLTPDDQMYGGPAGPAYLIQRTCLAFGNTEDEAHRRAMHAIMDSSTCRALGLWWGVDRPSAVVALFAEATSAVSGPVVVDGGEILVDSLAIDPTWAEQCAVALVSRSMVTHGTTDDVVAHYDRHHATNGAGVQLVFSEAPAPSPVLAPCFKRYGENSSGVNNDLLRCGASAGDLVILAGMHDVYTSPPDLSSWPSPGWTTVVDLPVVGSRQVWAMWKVLEASDLAVAWTWPNGLVNRGTAVTVVVPGGESVETGSFWTRAAGVPPRPNDTTNIAPGFSIPAGADGRLLAFSFEATSAADNGNPYVDGGELIGSSWETNATWLEQVQVADAGAVSGMTSSSAVFFYYQNTQASNGAAIQMVVRMGGSPDPTDAVRITQVGPGGTRHTGYLHVIGSLSSPRPVTEIRHVRGKGVDGVTVWDVATLREALNSGGKPRVAHRGGGADHPEMSLFAYTMAATRGFPVLEMSLARTSDGVWFGLHDQTLARVTAGASTAAASSLTWAQVQQYKIAASITSDPSQPDREFCRVEDLLSVYGQTHCIFLDPKYELARTAELLSLAESWYMGRGNTPAQAHIVFKYYGIEDGNGANLARSRGYTTWGYFYAGDLALLPTYASQWDWLGFSYDGTQADWDTVLSYGKPVLAHIPVTEDQVQLGFSKGAHGAMVSGTEQAYVVPVKNAEGAGPVQPFELGVTRPTKTNVGAGTFGYPTPTVVQGTGNQSILYIEDGQVVENRIIRQWVRIRPGGILRNCIIAGPDVVSDLTIPMVLAAGGTWTGNNPAIIENCTFAPGMYAPAALRAGFGACISGNRYIARYCVATGTRDCFATQGLTAATYARIEGCWGGEMMHLVPDTATSRPDTHNDGYQDYGSTVDSLPTGAVTIVGTALEGTRHPQSDPLAAPDRQSLAVIMLSKSGGNYGSVVLDRCWLTQGVQTINAVPDTPAGAMRLSVQGCRLEKGTADGGTPPSTDGVIMPYVSAYVGGYVDLEWGDQAQNTWLSGGVATPIVVGDVPQPTPGTPSAPVVSPAHQYVAYGQNVPITWVHDPAGTGTGGQSARAFRWSVNEGASWTSVAKANSTSTSRSLSAQPGSVMWMQARTYDQNGTASPWSRTVTAVCLAEGESLP